MNTLLLLLLSSDTSKLTTVRPGVTSAYLSKTNTWICYTLNLVTLQPAVTIWHLRCLFLIKKAAAAA